MFFGSIPALITPFRDEGECVDFDCFARLVQEQIDAGSDAIVIGGTTGEFPTLEGYELEKLVAIGVEKCRGKIPVIVGTGSNATKKSVRLTQLTKELGADGCLVTVPYYNKPTRDGITKHFKEVARVGLPVIVYHHPGRTGITLSVDHILELCEISGVVAIKDSSGNVELVERLLEERGDLSILCGDDELLLDYLKAGAVGIISVMANLLPSYWKRMVKLIWDDQEEDAEELFENFRDIVWATNLEVNPQGIKCAMSLEKGVENSLRAPLIPVTDKTEQEIKTALESLVRPELLKVR